MEKQFGIFKEVNLNYTLHDSVKSLKRIDTKPLNFKTAEDAEKHIRETPELNKINNTYLILEYYVVKGEKS